MDESSSLPWTQSKPLPPSWQKRRAKAKRNARRRTPEQNKEVSDAMARAEAGKPFEVTLRYQHYINGESFGPGKVRLPGPIARALSAQEVHVAREEEKFRGTRAGIIGGRTAQGTHRVTMVPFETFSDSYGTAMPVERISGAGLQDPGTGAGESRF